MILTYTAKETDRNRTVYSVARRELLASAALTKRLKAVGAISVSGEPVFADYRLSPGETVELDISAAEPECDNLPEQGDLEILFENEGLVAVNKPVGMLVHPTRSRNTGTLANYVAGYLLSQATQETEITRGKQGMQGKQGEQERCTQGYTGGRFCCVPAGTQQNRPPVLPLPRGKQAGQGHRRRCTFCKKQLHESARVSRALR